MSMTYDNAAGWNRAAWSELNAKCDCDPGDASATGGVHRHYCAIYRPVDEPADLPAQEDK